MTPDDIAARLDEALARPNADSGAWSPPHVDRDAFLDLKRAELRAARVVPYAVTFHPGDEAALLGPWEDREYTLFVVARAGPDVLLFDPGTLLFTLGLVAAAGRYAVTGYSSGDALAEWIT
ncbi:MAG: hypothetical protein HY749_09880 [Gammaproteobacteria bacterium]|nr:hypothetical protein [Gammaproteobacteria bacterium]MBI5617787.1 hypothetical protein [Gammaproteobacteria bacterium]